MTTHVSDATARPRVPGRRRLSAAERFERHCERLPNGCKRWLGGGAFSLTSAPGGHARPQVAAFRLHRGLGPLSAGRRVAATCDFEGCVEGAHLTLQNTRGAFEASPERTADILDAVRRGETYESIGARYLVSRQRIEQVVRKSLVSCPTCGGCGKVMPAARARAAE